MGDGRPNFVQDPQEGSSVSAIVSGSIADELQEGMPAVQVIAIGLEFGTQPIMSVLTALHADHWLNAVEGRQIPLREAIKKQIRDAFYVDKPAWRAAVYGRTADIVLRAVRGLAMPTDTTRLSVGQAWFKRLSHGGKEVRDGDPGERLRVENPR